MYIPSLSQSNAVTNLFINNPKLESVFTPILISTAGFGEDEKCLQDVRELRNLFMVWRTVLYSDLRQLMDAPNGRCQKLGPMAEIFADFLNIIATELSNKNLR